MPIVSNVEELVRRSHYEELRLGPRELLLSQWLFQPRLCFQFSVFLLRLRMEIVEGSAHDVAALKRYAWITLHRNYQCLLDVPASTLILEDWLRKAVMKINKSRSRQLDRYLNRAFLCSLGELRREEITPCDFLQMSMRLTSSSFKPSHDVVLRFHFDGFERRPVIR